MGRPCLVHNIKRWKGRALEPEGYTVERSQGERLQAARSGTGPQRTGCSRTVVGMLCQGGMLTSR
eukprot:39044-Eustigmatos_ZCMA.PRE.1